MFFLFSPSKGTLLDKVLLSSRWPSSFFPTCNPLTNLDFYPNWSYCVSPVSCELSNIGKFLWLTRVKAQSRLYSILSSLTKNLGLSTMLLLSAISIHNDESFLVSIGGLYDSFNKSKITDGFYHINVVDFISNMK